MKTIEIKWCLMTRALTYNGLRYIGPSVRSKANELLTQNKKASKQINKANKHITNALLRLAF